MTKSEISASTLKGDVRDFLLTWIQSMDTPFHKMSEKSQRDVIWAAEAQAHNLISAITMVIANRGFPNTFCRISTFGIKDGVEAKVTADATQDTVLNFLDFKGKAAVLVFADPAVYADERRPARYFPDEPDMFSDGGEDVPPDDGGAGGGEAKERPKPTRPRRRHGPRISADNSQPGGEMPNIPVARINQAFTGENEPDDPIENDIWKDGSGLVWGFRNGKWVNKDGKERPPSIMPAPADTKPPETDQTAPKTDTDPPAADNPAPAADQNAAAPDRERQRYETPEPPASPIEGDVWQAPGSTVAYTRAGNDWVDLATGEIKPGTIPSLEKAPAGKNKKIENPAPAGSWVDPKTGKKDPKDPGEPAEVTEDSGQPVITKSTGEPNEIEEGE